MSIRAALAALTLAGACLLAPSPAAGSVAGSVAPAAPRAGCDLTPAPGFMTCHATRAGGMGGAIAPDVTPAGYGPKDLTSAYHLATTGGAGATVAIVDAYNDPNAAADLAVYRAQYGLPACTVATGCFQQVNQNGASSPLPANNAGWAGEETLSLDMVSAICPHCHLLLIEATTSAARNLYAAEDEAVTLGAKYITNGWGGPESSSETASDVHFNHPGVAITASSGSAGMPDYPGASRYVTAVGGTTLVRAANPRGWTETAWGGSGSGCSVYEATPPWQTVPTTCSRRAVSDVAAVADPTTPVAAYQTYGASGWVEYGGGSVPPPIIAAVYALAGVPASGTYPASYPYAHPGGLFDITTGSNGSCGPPLCAAGPGWDGPTGLGTPNGTTAFKA